MIFQASGARLGTFLQALANMGTALVIAFVFGWQLSLVILAFVPFLAIGGFVEMKIIAGVSNRDKEAVEEASKVRNCSKLATQIFILHLQPKIKNGGSRG